MNRVYKKNFIFKANRFEEYSNGVCINKGSINTTIVAKVMDESTIAMGLLDDVPSNLNTRFGLPIFGIQNGDVLEDRIQYGRIPDSFCWNDPNEPLVCNIFKNMTCIRFAMLSPLRIVEFKGQFVDIQ